MTTDLTAPSTLWLRHYRPRDNPRLRLFCFPYAGGGASIYRTWGDHLPAEVEVCPVQLPGREERLRETAYVHVGPLCEALAEGLASHLNLPVALFGHSMGAIIAYEVARMLQAQGRPPVHLLISGQRAPHLPLNRRRSYDLPEAAFKQRLRELNGTPEAVLADEELMRLMLPLLRSDFELSETYLRTAHEPLRSPVTAFGGLWDAEVSRADLDAWRQATTGPFDLEMFPGDHFYLLSTGARLAQAAAERIRLGVC